MTWHVLDVGSIWMKEFASALSRAKPIVAWCPQMSKFSLFGGRTWEEFIPDPALRVRWYRLQRGYHRFPLSALVGLGKAQRHRMLQVSPDEANTPLVCSTPYYAPVAEQWAGPVIYYVTDLTWRYAGLDPEQVRSLDRRLCRVATLVCPNSERIAEYLRTEAWCDGAKIQVVPNATREVNVFSAPPSGPGALPDDIADLPRPIAGVIGNLAGNMHWRLLQECIAARPGVSWAFVGPTTMSIADPVERQARADVMAAGPHVRFIGSRPYHQLRDYARAFDAAVLPYRRHEPTYSGSSTRFYEHLAACRPILATRGFEELLRKEPLLSLFDTAEELGQAFDRLAASGWSDGLEQQRWIHSQQGTWENRASTMISALDQRWSSQTGQLSSRRACA